MKPVLYFIKCRLRSRRLFNTVSFLVVAVSVAVIIVALSISNGFQTALLEKIIVASPQVSIFGETKNVRLPDNLNIQDVLEVAQVQALALNPKNNQVQGVLVRGTMPENIPELFKNKHVLDYGVYPGVGQVIIGSKLADDTALTVGDKVKIMTGPAIFQEFQISGIFKVGLYDFDSTVVIATMDDIIAFTPMPGEGVASRVDVFKALWLNDPFLAKDISQDIVKMNPQVNVFNWQDDNKSLVNAIALEKKVIFIVLLLLVVATSIAIANSQFIQIIAQREQIAILSAIGFTANRILTAFILEGFLIGLIGSIAGVLLAFGLVSFLASYPISLPMDVYQVEVIPVKLENKDILLTSLTAISMVVISSLIPAYYASRMDPVEILRRL